MAANKTHQEKCRREPHKNVTSYLEHMIEAAPDETTTVWPLTSHLKTIQVRRTRHAGHSWRSKDELISDVLLWTPTRGHAWPTSKNFFYIRSVRTQDIILKICRERWMIGMDGERERERVRERGGILCCRCDLIMMKIYIYIYIYIYVRVCVCDWYSKQKTNEYNRLKMEKKQNNISRDRYQ